jgi:hypothetical protein
MIEIFSEAYRCSCALAAWSSSLSRDRDRMSRFSPQSAPGRFGACDKFDEDRNHQAGPNRRDRVLLMRS